MKKTVFWIGIVFLVVGTALFSYAFTTIQNIYIVHGDWGRYFYLPEVELQWKLAQTLQSIGLGMLAIGAIMTVYGNLVKKLRALVLVVLLGGLLSGYVLGHTVQNLQHSYKPVTAVSSRPIYQQKFFYDEWDIGQPTSNTTVETEIFRINSVSEHRSFGKIELHWTVNVQDSTYWRVHTLCVEFRLINPPNEAPDWTLRLNRGFHNDGIIIYLKPSEYYLSIHIGSQTIWGLSVSIDEFEYPET